MRETFALDIETTGLNPFEDKILGIGVVRPGAFSRFFDDIDSFRSWFEACEPSPEKIGFIFHRGAFDLHFLARSGLDLYPYFQCDTRSLSSLLCPQPELAGGERHKHSLQNLGRILLSLPAWKLDRAHMASYQRADLEAYCLLDCEITYHLYTYFQKALDRKAWDFVENWLMPVTRLCARLEYEGVYIDDGGLQDFNQKTNAQKKILLEELQALGLPGLKAWQEKQTEALEEQYHELKDKALKKAKDDSARDRVSKRYESLFEKARLRLEAFNWSSSAQLSWLLRDFYGLNLKNREGKETTNEAKLKELKHPVAEKLVEFREVDKLLSTCIPALLSNRREDGCVHASYHIGGTRTGRLSSSNPNLQQIPRGELRSYVTAADEAHCLVTLDYAQIEVRIIAELAQEKALLDGFRNNIDPYSLIAQKLMGLDHVDVRELKHTHKRERDVAKTAGLSILYGTGPGRLKEVLHKELGRTHSIQECKAFIDNYRNSLPAVQALRQKLERALANQKIYYNLLGRPFYIHLNEDLYMQSLNTLVQGSASDLVLWGQTQFVIPLLNKHEIPFKHRMLIHDEVVIELPKEKAEKITKELIVPAMTTHVSEALSLQVPLKIEYTIAREWSKP